MRYVEIVRERRGNLLDPAAYLEALPGFESRLPRGARAFATDPAHYDRYGKRCVKDLKPAALILDEQGSAELRLTHNCWKHEENLTISYSGVRSVLTDPAPAAADIASLQDLMLDEILPHDAGCHHEIAFLSGTLTITAADLTATWTYAECDSR